MKIWLVNSNSKKENNNENGFRYMLEQNRVMSYYDRRTEVDKINDNDLVLLYHNKTGIIAVGFALETKLHDFDDISKIEHWKNVNWIWKANFIIESSQFTNAIDIRKIGIEDIFGTVLSVENLNAFNLLKEMSQSQK